VNQRSPEQEARQQSCHASCGPGQRQQPGPAVSVRVPLPHPLQPGLKPLPDARRPSPASQPGAFPAWAPACHASCWWPCSFGASFQRLKPQCGFSRLQERPQEPRQASSSL